MHPADWAGLVVAHIYLDCWIRWRCALDGQALSIRTTP
jgi:hypothetical protein